MRLDAASGLVTPARQVPSPNCDERPDPADISLVVVHGISLPPGEFGGGWVEKLFTNTLPPDAHPYFAEIHTLRVSSHFYIPRGGELVQFVPVHRRAWHAGVSRFAGRDACNDFSIGIELEGADDTPYEPAQYETLAALVRELMRVYPAIGPGRVVGHCHIAPGRKTDPGEAFQWPRLLQALGTPPPARA